LTGHMPTCHPTFNAKALKRKEEEEEDTGFIMWQPNGWISTIL